MVMSAQEILDAVGKAREVSDQLGVTVQAVHNMKTRKKIPPRHWPRLVEMAQSRGLKKITLETLTASYNSRLA